MSRGAPTSPLGFILSLFLLDDVEANEHVAEVGTPTFDMDAPIQGNWTRGEDPSVRLLAVETDFARCGRVRDVEDADPVRVPADVQLASDELRVVCRIERVPLVRQRMRRRHVAQVDGVRRIGEVPEPGETPC